MREGGSLSTRAFSRRTRWREMREGRRGSWLRVSMPSYFGSLPKEQAPTKYLSEGEAEVRVGAGGGGRGAGVQIPQLRGSRKSFKRIDPTDGGQRSMTYLFQRQYCIFVKRRSVEYAGL